MNLNEARDILGDPESSFSDKYRATTFLTHTEGVPLRDIVSCLRVGGVCTEMAAMRLHRLTARPLGGGDVGLITDAEDWAEYLRQNPKYGYDDSSHEGNG